MAICSALPVSVDSYELKFGLDTSASTSNLALRLAPPDLDRFPLFYRSRRVAH